MMRCMADPARGEWSGQSGESIWQPRVELPGSKEQPCNEAPIG